MAERKSKKKIDTPISSDDELPFTKVYTIDEDKKSVCPADASHTESTTRAEPPAGTIVRRTKTLKGLMPITPYVPVTKRTELKHATMYRTFGGCPAGGDITSLNTLETGTDYDERIGRKVISTRIELRFICMPPTTTSSYDAVRVIIFYDQQPNGTTAVASDLMDLGVCNKPYLSPYNRTVNQDRFVILHDWSSNLLYVSSTDASMVANPTHHDFNMKVPKKLSSATYGIAGLAVPITGELGIAVFTYNNSATTNNNASFAYCARLFYIDG